MNRRMLVILAVIIFTILPGNDNFVWARGEEGLKSMPVDAVLVMHVDWASLVQTGTYEKYSKLFSPMMPTDNPEFEAFKAGTGFNPETDLTSMTIGFSGDLTVRPAMFTYLEGEFNIDKYQAFAREKETLEIGETHGVVTFTGKEAVSQKQASGIAVSAMVASADESARAGALDRPAMAFLDNNTMIMASADHFTNMLERAQGAGKNVHSSPQIGPLLNKGLKGLISIPVIMPERPKEMFPFIPQVAGLAHIEALSVSLDVGEVSTLTLAVLANSPANGQGIYTALKPLVPIDGKRSRDGSIVARMLNQVRPHGGKQLSPDVAKLLQGALALGKMMISDQPDALNLLNNLQVSQDGAITKLSLAMSPEELNEFMQKAIMFGGL